MRPKCQHPIKAGNCQSLAGHAFSESKVGEGEVSVLGTVLVISTHDSITAFETALQLIVIKLYSSAYSVPETLGMKKSTQNYILVEQHKK